MSTEDLSAQQLPTPAAVAPPPLRRRFDDVDQPDHHGSVQRSSTIPKRSKRSSEYDYDYQSDEDHITDCDLMMLSRSHSRFQPDPLNDVVTTEEEKIENPNNIATVDDPATTSAAIDVKRDESSSHTPPLPSSPRNVTFKCNICGKVFTSPQALGGHKTVHRPRKPAAAAASNSGDRVHECSVCHKTFPSGQALGGHKRKHYEGVVGGKGKGCATNSSNTSHGDKSGLTSDGGGAAVPRDFDLNLPPPPEDEDTES